MVIEINDLSWNGITRIIDWHGARYGYSFAVPSNIVRKVFEDLIEFGNVQKGLLGVSGNALNTDIAEKFDIDDTSKLEIISI